LPISSVTSSPVVSAPSLTIIPEGAAPVMHPPARPPSTTTSGQLSELSTGKQPGLNQPLLSAVNPTFAGSATASHRPLLLPRSSSAVRPPPTSYRPPPNPLPRSF
jgi:hypothetical protein